MEQFDVSKHSDRYFKSICLCDYPYPSYFWKDRCAVCGGILPPPVRSLHTLPKPTPEARPDYRGVVVTVLGILALLALLVLSVTR